METAEAILLTSRLMADLRAVHSSESPLKTADRICGQWYARADLASILIALNQLLWDAYNTGNETVCEFWTDMFHDLRNKILEEKNTFSLTEDEISSILTIID